MITKKKNYVGLSRLLLYVTIVAFAPLSGTITEKCIKKLESQIPTQALESLNQSIQQMLQKEASGISENNAQKHNLPNKATPSETVLMMYLSGVNNLGYFLRRNLSQLAETGSHAYLKIIVQLDALLPGNKKVTKRYLVEKNKLTILNQNDKNTQSMDSGDPNSLISFCKFVIENFPAKHYLLGISNHATGILEVAQTRAVNPSELFTFNPLTNMIELDRKIPFLEYISGTDQQRGICFDDITGNYLTNQKLAFALRTICAKYLHRKFDLIFFDACLQGMYEIALWIEPFAHRMAASQEVILAPGFDYKDVLTPFEHKFVDPALFTKHLVASYENTYKKITQDYTLSAIDLTTIKALENNVNLVAQLLIDCMNNKKTTFAKEAIKTSRHKLLCTHFDEPSYVDLHHLYSNLLSNFERHSLKAEQSDPLIKTTLINLKQALRSGLNIIQHVVIANTAGKNLSKAQGISIYFPEYGRKHPSYNYNHVWSSFIDKYLKA